MPYPAAGRPEHTRKDLIAVLILVASAASLGFLSLDEQLAVVRVLRGSVLMPVLRIHAGFVERASLKKRLHDLSVERDSLAIQITSLRELAFDNADLRALLDTRTRPIGRFVVATVVPGQPRIGQSHSFVLTAGRREGVEPPTAVLTGRGLLGVVRSTSEHTSVGDFWTHADFRVSVRTVDGRSSGIIRASPVDADQPGMILDGAPFQTEIPPRTVLVTTGLFGIYPPGIPVGTVDSVVAVESGWEKSYAVEPAVRPEQEDVALVWVREPVAPDE